MKHWWQLLSIFALGITLSFCLNVVRLHSLASSYPTSIEPSGLVQQAQKAYYAGEFERSIKLLQQANQIYQDREKRLPQVQIFSLISLAQQQLGNWQAAEQSIANSLALIQTLPASQPRTQALAQIWNAKGHLKFATAKPRQALKDWEKAEKLYRQNEDLVGIAGSLLAQAEALENMGFNYRSCDYILRAFDRSDYDCQNLTNSQVNAIVERVKQEKQPWQIEGLTKLSNTLLSRGKLSQAETFILAARTVNSNIDNSAFSTKAKVILSLGNINKAMAFRARDIEDKSSFDTHTQKAVKYYQQLINEQPPAKIVRKYQLSAQLNLLSLYIANKQWSEAQKLVARIQIQPDDRKTNLYAEIKFALNLEQLKQNRVAIEYSWQDIAELYLKTIARARENGDLRAQSYALGYLGILQSKHDRFRATDSPQKLIESALNLAQQIQAPEIAYRWQWQLGKIYGAREQRQLAIANYRAALSSLVSLRQDLASLSQEVQFDFHQQIEPVYKEFAKLLLSGKSVSNSDMANAVDVIESLQIAELDNYFQDACTTFEAKQIGQIDKDAIAIYTLILSDSLEVIIEMDNPNDTSTSTFSHHSQSIARQDLETIVKQLRTYITEPDRTLEIQTLSAQLYDLLIRPFETEITKRQTKNIVFILDSILQAVPMSILYDGEKYLLEKQAIAITPGIRMLNLQNPAKQPSFLAGGITKSLQVKEQNFVALDNIQSELDLFSDTKSKILVDRDFTAKNLLQQLDRTSASHIHLATHGQFSSDPERTFLLMWQQLLTIKQFGDLLQTRRQRIYTPIDLLVLSACDTASGDRYAALGLAGVAVRSGALSTLATLWQVNDESTAALMKSFYRHLKSDRPLAEALRLAQLELWQRKDKDWQVPAFWSAYVAIGNWQ